MQNTWNTALYETQHAFVWQSATDLIELRSPQPEEHILDLGCGTGQLTAQVAKGDTAIRDIDWNGILTGLNPEMQDRVIQSVEAQLNPKLYRDQAWVADYRRLRLMAIKQSEDKS
jgi:trans-aconitate methyltransferase